MKEPNFRSTAACWPPAATWSFTGRWTAGSRRSTRAPARSSGSSKVASGIVGNPMTYLGPDNKQYVAIYAGIGGWMGAVAFPTCHRRSVRRLGVVGAMKDIKKYTAPGTWCMSLASRVRSVVVCAIAGRLTESCWWAACRIEQSHEAACSSMPAHTRPPTAARRCAPLRVCADPNNMPFSNRRGEGFENRIAGWPRAISGGA